MTSVGSVGASGMEWINTLRQTSQQGQEPAAMRRSGMRPPAGKGPGVILGGQFDSFAETSGLDSEAAEAVKDEMLMAVREAVEGAEGSSRREAVQDAIRGVLEENGLDADQFLDQLEAARNDRDGTPMDMSDLSVLDVTA